MLKNISKLCFILMFVITNYGTALSQNPTTSAQDEPIISKKPVNENLNKTPDSPKAPQVQKQISNEPSLIDEKPAINSTNGSKEINKQDINNVKKEPSLEEKKPTEESKPSLNNEKDKEEVKRKPTTEDTEEPKKQRVKEDGPKQIEAQEKEEAKKQKIKEEKDEPQKQPVIEDKEDSKKKKVKEDKKEEVKKKEDLKDDKKDSAPKSTFNRLRFQVGLGLSKVKYLSDSSESQTSADITALYRVAGIKKRKISISGSLRYHPMYVESKIDDVPYKGRVSGYHLGVMFRHNTSKIFDTNSSLEMSYFTSNLKPSVTVDGADNLTKSKFAATLGLGVDIKTPFNFNVGPRFYATFGDVTLTYFAMAATLKL